MTRNPSRQEQETIFSYNKEETIAHIFSYDKSLQRHLEKRCGEKPTFINSCGGRGYEIPKNWVRYPLPKRVATESQRNNLAKARSKSPILSAETPASVGVSDDE